MKELLLIGTTVFALTSGGMVAGNARAEIVTHNQIIHTRGEHISVARLQALDIKAQDAINARRMEAIRNNTIKVDKAIAKLKHHVGKTWYVFSGNTPAGWDCSGLTMWFYEQSGIDLKHRASAQAKSGIATNNPKPGDLVAFKYKGTKSAYHVGIYIGNGKMIHAPKHGHLTRIENIKQFAGKYSDILYREIVKII